MYIFSLFRFLVHMISNNRCVDDSRSSSQSSHSLLEQSSMNFDVELSESIEGYFHSKIAIESRSSSRIFFDLCGNG